MCAAEYLYNIVQSEYYGVRDWQAWADSVILNNDTVDSWIYDISLAKNEDEFRAVVNEQMTVEFEIRGGRLSYDSNIIVGYYYLMYRENRMTRSDLIDILSDEDSIASDSDIFDIDVSKVNHNELDSLLMPFLEKALEQKRYLESYRLSLKE